MNFEKLQRRKTIYPITIESINRVPCSRILDNGGKVDKKIQEFHKKLLKIAKDKNNSKEMGMLINIETWEYVILKGTENRVSIFQSPKSRDFYDCAGTASLMFIHNHPDNSHFSYKDFESFVNDDKLVLATAICNNGNIHFMQKVYPFYKEGILYLYNQFYFKEKGKNTSVIKTLQHSREYGLIYGFRRCSK